MNNTKPIKLKLILVLSLALIIIPNLLIRNQRDNPVSFDEKNPNEIINTRPPQESSVYYEDTNGDARDVYVSGNYAYVADALFGLAVIDISDPANPGTPVYEDTTGYAYGVYVSGDYAYVADYESGLAVIDISDPANPGTPVYEDTFGLANGVYVSGDYAYVADGDSGLVVINISDPTNPGTPIYEDTTGRASDVYVSGNYAYVADYTSGLAVIDISNSTNPGTPVYEDTTGQAYGVYVSGDYAYLADDTSGLAVIDISNSTNPGTPVYEDTTGGSYGVYVSGNYAYLADSYSGLAIIDISDPTNPGTPVYEDTTSQAFGIYVSGNYAYLADSYSGLAITPLAKISITDPTWLTYCRVGSSYNITWTSRGSISLVKIELYSFDYVERDITSNTDNDGSYFWSVPSSIPSNDFYRVIITDISDSSISDSTSYFSIYNPAPDIFNTIVFIVIIISVVVVSLVLIVIYRKKSKRKVKIPEEERIEKESVKIEERKITTQEDIQERMFLVDSLIKEKKLDTALKNLINIQKEAQAQGLKNIENKVEEKIIYCKKLVLDTVNLIKQTILTLGAKFTRLELSDISEKSGIQDETLIEGIIQDMIKNKEIYGEYFATSKALSLEIITAVPVKEKAAGKNVFISYSTLDTDYFQVSKIVRRLELYPEINRVLFWEVDSKQNIVEFMEETLKITDVFVLFCSENSIKSGAVKGEWQSAYQMVKRELMKIIPVYEDEEYIPRLLWQLLNVKFTKDDFEGFIQNLYEEILR